MAGEVERQVVEAEADDAAPAPVGVDLRVVRARPRQEVRPAQHDAQVPEQHVVHHLKHNGAFYCHTSSCRLMGPERLSMTDNMQR